MSKANFAKYKEYRSDFVGKLDFFPSHWSVKRIQDIGQIQYGLGQPPAYQEMGLPFIRATNVERGKIVDKGMEFIKPEDIPVGRNPILKENDLIVVRSGAYTGDSAIIPSKYDGAVAGYDLLLRPSTKRIIPKYISYTLLSNYVLRDQLILDSFRAAQPHLNKEELSKTIIVVPPLEEQQAIADYLDAKTKQIDRKIELLESKAEKYADLKQSLINETVTRGLDKSVPVKDSGVEWIGQIPSHWEVKRLKDVGFLYSGLAGKSGEDFTRACMQNQKRGKERRLLSWQRNWQPVSHNEWRCVGIA